MAASTGPPAPGVVMAGTAARRLAVAGNPNAGKTTLFNALTGLRHHVGNYPGVTVERREGRANWEGVEHILLDLPGTYSLSAHSPDEQIARDVLLGRVDGTPAPDGALVVVDAGNLERNLYLATQILDLGLPAVIACNMMDVVSQRGTRLDLGALGRELGAAVVGTVGTRGDGLAALRRKLFELPSAAAPRDLSWLPSHLRREVNAVTAALRRESACRPEAAEGLAMLLLAEADSSAGGVDWIHAGVRAALRAAAKRLRAEGVSDAASALVEARYAWIASIVDRAVRSERRIDADTPSDRIDHVLTHRLWGLLIFAGLMFLMFLSIFAWAEPLMRFIERGQGLLQAAVRGALPAGPLRDLLADGLIGGAGSVVVFFPQICILFLFIAVLEDSGYMARAAFLMDRLMSRVGLHGKSFIPLLSSYACAVPGIMATRTIENPRDRLTTILVAPLMSCSARLPVYLTVIAAVFGTNVWLKTGVVFSMYALGTITALLLAAAFKRTLLAGPTPTFIMELPLYHLPRPWPIVRAMWDRSRLFLTRAGTTIVAVCVVLWALAYFPRNTAAEQRAEEHRQALATRAARPGIDSTAAGPSPVLRVRPDEIEHELAGEQLRQSYLGRLGRAIEPVLRPLGFDWRVGVGVLASFAAREVFVSTMGVVYNAGGAADGTATLRQRMQQSRWETGPSRGRPIFSTAAGLSLMIFYVFCCQCVSTLAVVRRETNSWRWPAFMFTYMTALAYVMSLGVYQLGRVLGGLS